MDEKITIKPQKPSRAWYLPALAIFLAGPLLAIYLLHSLYSASKHVITFYAPAISQVLIPKAGEYTLWTDIKNINNNPMPTDLKSMTVTFLNQEHHSVLRHTVKTGWSETKNQVSHYSLGTLKFDYPGIYNVAAVTTSPTLRPFPYKLSLRQPSLNTVFKILFLSIFSVIISVITGIIWALVVLLKRLLAREAMTPTPVQTHSDMTPQATTWAMVCHLSGFAGFIFPLANILAPLLIWGLKRQEFPYVDEQGKEAINFQISITIYYLIASLLILVIIGLFLLPLLAAFQIIAMIIASIEAAHGKHFHYPLTIRFLR